MASSLEDKIKALDAQKKKLQAKLSKQKRAEDTRRKILLGSLLMAHMQNERITSWVKKELPEFLTREHDKELFKDWLTDADSEQQLQDNEQAKSVHQKSELAEA